MDRRSVQVARKHSALGFVILLGMARQAAAIPADDLLNSLQPTADVNDFAGILAPAEKEALEQRCRQLRERTGAQLAVVTLKSLEGGQIDDFANKLFKRWGIGQKDKRNGLLLLVAIDDRKVRIEVGYGLEPIIPDALAGRIIDRQLRPDFRNGNYAAGLTAAVNSLCELVEKGEPPPDVANNNDPLPANHLFTVLFLAAFVAIGGYSLGVGLGLPQAESAVFGAFFGGVAILIGCAIAGTFALLVHLVVGALFTAIGWSSVTNHGGPGQSGRRRTNRSNWDWGQFPASSGGGWSSGSGGFSQGWGGFGGGSSGGGGASGGW